MMAMPRHAVARFEISDKRALLLEKDHHEYHTFLRASLTTSRPCTFGCLVTKALKAGLTIMALEIMAFSPCIERDALVATKFTNRELHSLCVLCTRLYIPIFATEKV